MEVDKVCAFFIIVGAIIGIFLGIYSNHKKYYEASFEDDLVMFFIGAVLGGASGLFLWAIIFFIEFV